MKKTPDQELFDYFFKQSIKLGFETYDHLVTDEIPYPFVVIGEAQTIQLPTKSAMSAGVSLMIHVWGSQTQRQKISNAANEFIRIARNLTRTESFNWQNDYQASSSQIIEDTSTNEPLWHGVINIEMKLF